MSETKSTENRAQASARRRVPRAARLLLGTLALACVAYVGHRNYNGYCSAQGRVLSDDEVVRAAIGYVAYEMGVENNEDAIRAYVATHPNCCQVDRMSHLTAGWLARLIGLYWVVVDLRYEVPPEFIQRSGGKSYRNYENHVEVTACGKRGEIFGEFRDPGK